MFFCLFIILFQFLQINLLYKLNSNVKLTQTKLYLAIGILVSTILAPVLYSNLLASTAPELAHLWRRIQRKKPPTIKRETGTCLYCDGESKYSLEIDGRPIPLCKSHLVKRLETDQRVLAAMVLHFIDKVHLSKKDQEG